MIAAVTLDTLEIEPDPAEVLRYLGYPAGAAPDPVIKDRVGRAIDNARTSLRPRGVYSLYPILRQTRRSLSLADAEFTGPVGEFLTGAQKAAAFVGTAGPQVIRMTADAFASGDRLAGIIYNALGSHIADATAERILEELRGCLGRDEELTLPYSPGYCGIPLAQQESLFRLVDAASIGVELLPTYIMKPLKSVSGLVGIGPKDAVTAYGNPCDKCPLTTCRMRR